MCRTFNATTGEPRRDSLESLTPNTVLCQNRGMGGCTTVSRTAGICISDCHTFDSKDSSWAYKHRMVFTRPNAKQPLCSSLAEPADFTCESPNSAHHKTLFWLGGLQFCHLLCHSDLERYKFPGCLRNREIDLKLQPQHVSMRGEGPRWLSAQGEEVRWA